MVGAVTEGQYGGGGNGVSVLGRQVMKYGWG